MLQKVSTSVPTPTGTQILLKIHAVAFNPVGNKSIQYFPSFMVKKPCIPESDVAEIIVALGGDVQGWNIGDEVFGWDVFKTGHGGLAEYTLLQKDNMLLLKLVRLMVDIANRNFLAGKNLLQFLSLY